MQVLLPLPPLVGLTYQHLPWQTWQADHHTAVGERQQITLPDGGSLILNTDTVVNIEYSTEYRQILLHQGEILITTAKDVSNRPFFIKSQHGLVQALGTRFIVHTDEEKTQVTVLEKSVRITLALTNNKTILVDAKQEISFTAYTYFAIKAAKKNVDSWLNGSLVVVDMPLGELIDELARYRPGLLSCEPSVTHHKVSGAFPIDNTELALDAITSSFPVRQKRFSRYWVKIVADN